MNGQELEVASSSALDTAMTDDDELETVCRICRMPAEADNPLYHPCRCSGSIRYVHSSCLNVWLARSKHDSCELCHHKFHFKPLFAENAPSRLPWGELLYGIAMKTGVAAKFACRVILVLFVWMFVVPLATRVMWRLAFTRDIQEGWRVFTFWHDPLLGVLADVVHGAFISLSLGCGLLLLSSAWDYFRQHAEVLGVAGMGPGGLPGPAEGPLDAQHHPRDLHDAHGLEALDPALDNVGSDEEGVGSSDEGVPQYVGGVRLASSAPDGNFVREEGTFALGYLASSGNSDPENGAMEMDLGSEFSFSGGEEQQVTLREAADMLAGPGALSESRQGMVIITSEVRAALRDRRERRQRGEPNVPSTYDDITVGWRSFRRRRRRRRRSPPALPAEGTAPWGPAPAAGPTAQEPAWGGPTGLVPSATFSTAPLPLSSQAQEGSAWGLGAGVGIAPAGTLGSAHQEPSAVPGRDAGLVAHALRDMPSTSSGSPQPFPRASAPPIAPHAAPARSVTLYAKEVDSDSDVGQAFGKPVPGGSLSALPRTSVFSDGFPTAVATASFGVPSRTDAAAALQVPLAPQGPAGSSSRSLQAHDSPLAGWEGTPASTVSGPFTPSTNQSAAVSAGLRNPFADSTLTAQVDAPSSASSPSTVRSDTGPSLAGPSGSGGPMDPSAGTGNQSPDDRRAAPGSLWSFRAGVDVSAGSSGLGSADRMVGSVDHSDDPNRRRKAVRWSGNHVGADEPSLPSPRAWTSPSRPLERHRPATEDERVRGAELRQRRRVVVRRPQGQRGPAQGGAQAVPLVGAPPARIPALAPDNGQRDAGPQTFEELAGLQGPLRLLGESLLTVLLMSFIFIFVALFIPFNLGRAAVAGVAALQAALAPDHQVPFLLMLLHNPAAVPAINGTADGMLHSPAGQAGNLTEAIAPPLHNASGQGYNFSTASGPGGNATGAGSARASGAQITLLAAWLGRIVEQVEVHFEGPNLLDWVCLVVGYCIVAGLLLLGLWAFLTWKILFSGHWRRGMERHGSMRAFFRAVLVNVWQQFVSYVSYATLAAKVVLVLVLELLVLPAAHGFFIDVCMLPFLGGTIQGRLRLFAYSPITWTMVHWSIGMAFLMSVGSLLSLSRRLLRPGALPWLHDPYDGEQEQMRLLFQMPVYAHLEREAVAFGIMATVAVALVHVPVCICTFLPGLLPLRFHFFNVDQVLDLMLFHIFLPFTLPYIRLRETFCLAYSWWLRSASALVGLEDYLLPPRTAPNAVPPQNAPVPPAPAANPAPAPAPPPAAQPPAATAHPVPASAQDVPPHPASDAEPLLAAGHSTPMEAGGTGDLLAQDAPTEQVVAQQQEASPQPAPPLGAAQDPAGAGPEASHPGAPRLPDPEESVPNQDPPAGPEAVPRASALAAQGDAGETAVDAPVAATTGEAPARPVAAEADGPAREVGGAAREAGAAARQGFAWGGSPAIAGVRTRAPSVFNADGSVDEGLLYRRLLLLLVLLILTLVSLNVAILVVPIVTGRLVLRAANFPAENDVYGAVVGAYTLWGLYLALRHMLRLARHSNFQAFAMAVGSWLLNLAKLAVLAITAFVILPCLVGDFLNRILRPFRQQSQKMESRADQLGQNWSLGIVSLKLCYILTVGGLGGPGEPDQAGPAIVLDNGFRRRILALQARGWANVPFVAAFRDCLGPLLLIFCSLLLAPALLTQGLLKWLAVPVNYIQAVEQHAYLGEVLLVLAVLVLVSVHNTVRKLGRALHEERYVVGRQLTNLSDSE